VNSNQIRLFKITFEKILLIIDEKQDKITTYTKLQNIQKFMVSFVAMYYELQQLQGVAVFSQ